MSEKKQSILVVDDEPDINEIISINCRNGDVITVSPFDPLGTRKCRRMEKLFCKY